MDCVDSVLGRGIHSSLALFSPPGDRPVENYTDVFPQPCPQVWGMCEGVGCQGDGSARPTERSGPSRAPDTCPMRPVGTP